MATLLKVTYVPPPLVEKTSMPDVHEVLVHSEPSGSAVVAPSALPDTPEEVHVAVTGPPPVEPVKVMTLADPPPVPATESKALTSSDPLLEAATGDKTNPAVHDDKKSKVHLDLPTQKLDLFTNVMSWKCTDSTLSSLAAERLPVDVKMQSFISNLIKVNDDIEVIDGKNHLPFKVKKFIVT